MRKESQLTEANGKPVRVTITAEGQENHAPRCGPFDFNFRVWDENPRTLMGLPRSTVATIQDVRKTIDAVSGIQVYRDRRF